METNSGKKYMHDCDDCIFLGHEKDHDLYYHADPQSLIARASSYEPDYISGMALIGRVPAITAAYDIAIKQGLLPY